LGQLEPAAHLAQRLADVLAQDDAAAVQFHLEGGALGQAQRVAHGLGQGDLAAFGDGGFHGRPPRTKKVCIDYTYFRARTAIRISRHRVALAQRRGHGGGRTLATFIQPRSTDMADSFATRARLEVNGKSYAYASLPKLGERFDISKLPYSMKILLENLLRHEDGGVTVGPEHIEAVARWNPKAEPDTEIAFMPARVVLQDFTGVPCVVDLAAMRDAVVRLGGRAGQINPQIPSELVIDHSVQVDVFGRPDALDINGRIEFERNRERYGFLRWGQKAFADFKVVPPNTGIVHQVNIEHLARAVMARDVEGETWAFPDTVFGTDSHTTMVNGIGVLGWGVGGIEAEAAMLGQPSSMLIPQVVGFKLTGRLPEGATATDLVLTVTQMLR